MTHRVLRLTAVSWLLLAGALLVAHPVRGHIADATGGITHDLYTPANSARCVYGPDNCVTHSFTYTSANDVGGTNFICAELYKPTDHSVQRGESCWYGFVRLCIGTDHGGEEHCNDQDEVMSHAGAENRNGPGTTIRRHPVY
jgi:hypothetical protein